MKHGEMRKLRLKDVLPCLVFSFFAVLSILPISLHAEIDSLYQKGEAQFEQKQFDSAIISFNQLIGEFPQKKEGYFNRGLCFYKLDKYDTAISDFEKCLQIDSVFKEAEYLKALSLQKKGALKSAYTAFEVLNTKYTGYNGLKKRVFNYRLAVILSTNWYYMLAIMFMIIILFAIVSKSYSYKR